MAVASTGPARTGSPDRSATAWQSSSFKAPPPTRWTLLVLCPDSTEARPTAFAKPSAMLSTMLRTTPGRESGAATPWSRHQAAMRDCMSPGGRNRGSCTSKSTWSSTAAACASNVSRSASPQVRNVSDSSQVPITLVRKRVRPSTPASLVKFAARLSGVTTGHASSTPTRPQVPQEMYAESGSVIGTPTTADAVSWDPTVCTGTVAPTTSATCADTVPSNVPGSTSSGKMSGSTPSSLHSWRSQSWACTPKSPVVEAFVRSV